MSRVGMSLVMGRDMGLPSPTVVYYLDTKARERSTAPVPHAGVCLGLAGARAIQRSLRVIGGTGDSGRAGSHGPSSALGSALSQAKKGREVLGTRVL